MADTMREKLIELLSVVTCPNEICNFCEHFENGVACERHRNEVIADHLISNGVTLDNQVSSSKWIPVTERLPEKTMKCLCRYVFGDNYDYPFEQVLYYCSVDKTPHFQNEGSLGMKVTHWMPMPEPLKGE